MPFPARAVGLDLERTVTAVTARNVLAYAAGLDASEAAFLDDAQAGGLRALPFQCVSFEWPGLVSLRQALGDRLSAAEARRGVHAIQDSIFHRPILPGDDLVTEGRLVGAKRIRAGVLTVCKLGTRDANTGDPVTTSWSSSIYRDVGLDGDELALETPPELPDGAAQPLPPGAERTTIPIPRGMPHTYSECADIWNPIHTERREALAAGLPDIILHGTATWALAGLTILRRHGGSDVARLRRVSGRFSGMVIPGEDIVVRHAAHRDGFVQFEVLTKSGAVAISQGVAVLGSR